MKKALALTLLLALLLSALAGLLFVGLAKANFDAPEGIWVSSPQNKVYFSTEVELTFATYWSGTNVRSFNYSLDGQANVAITGNTTLTGLSWGSHNLLVHGYGNLRSQPVQFDVFLPTRVIHAFAMLIVVVGIGLLVYFKKHQLAMAFKGEKTGLFWGGLLVLA